MERGGWAVAERSHSVDPFADWPDRELLLDATGQPVLAFSRSERGSRPWADGAWRPPDAAAEAVAEVACRALAGWLLSSSDVELVSALTQRGGETRRQAHSMSLDLGPEPSPIAAPEGITVGQLSAELLAARAGEVGAVAYSAHADDGQGWTSAEAAAEAMQAVAAGRVLGPLLATSMLASRPHAVVGACLVVQREGVPPHGGPWVLDLFRDRSDPSRGIGGALLASAASAARLLEAPALSLAVDHDNHTARRLYHRLGFRDLGQSWTLAMPDRAERFPTAHD
jgi:ribosomal protein S18 acetylase RimI-like enzyme